METKHTRGPWICDGTVDNWVIFSDGKDICRGTATPSDVGEELANQNLICAAPDLLAECERVQDELANALRDGNQHFSPEMLGRWFKGISGVIARATGAT